MTRIEQLVNVLKEHEVFIQTHNFPDPDAIAAAFGIQQLLAEYNVDSIIVYEGSLNKLSGVRMIDYFNIKIFNAGELPEMNEDAYILIVDAQKYNKNCTDLPGIEIACIDHHPTVTECTEYEYSDIRMVGACSTLIAEYYLEAGIKPSVDVATALLYGIKMDTNDFGRGVNELDAKVYYELFHYADQHVLEKMQLNAIEYADLKAYGAAIESISVTENVGFACLPFDCPDGLIAIICDFILALDVVDFAVVYSIRPDGYKFSVRSELEEEDAGKAIRYVMEKIGGGSGGGHSFMAGGFLPNEFLDNLGDDKRATVEKLFMEYVSKE